jgi:predicted PurR-regulated permease PerM
MTTPEAPPPEERPAAAGPVDVRNVALTVIAVAAAIVLLRYMQEVFIPLALGILLFYAFDAPVDRLQRWRVPRAIGAALVLGLFVLGVVGLGYALQGQARAIVDRLPEGARAFREAVRGPSSATPAALEKIDQAAKELQKDTAPVQRGITRVQVEEPAFKVSDFLLWGSMNAALFMNQMVMVLFLTYFMLLSDDLFKRKVVEVVGPTLTKKKVTVQILDDIAGQIERFLVIQFFTSALVGVVTGVALWALGLEQAAFWGLVAGVFNSIPYYGPLLVTGALSAVAFLQFGTLGMTAAVGGVSLAITTAEGSLLTPTLMGRVAQINRVSMFAGLLFWTWMWGVWGLLLAVPMMMVVKAVSDRIEELQPLGQFLGE